MIDRMEEVHRLLTRVDDLIKAAPNRSDPAVAYRSARGLLEEAEWQLADIDEGTPRDQLTVAVGLRHDDLNRLMLLLDYPSRGTMDAPAAPRPLPQPDPHAQLFAWSHDGHDLPPEHGGPLRLVVPSRYAWKSVKWVTGLQFHDRDAPGYWEMRGYHNVADPWMEQRYA